MFKLVMKISQDIKELTIIFKLFFFADKFRNSDNELIWLSVNLGSVKVLYLMLTTLKTCLFYLNQQISIGFDLLKVNPRAHGL